MSVKIYGEADARTVAQIERCQAAEEGSKAVLCADNHLGYSQPIGGAVAYRDHISPSGVGYDIGCGNKAVRTNIKIGDLLGTRPSQTVGQVMDEIVKQVSFGVGRNNSEPVDHPVLDQIREASFAPQRQLYDLAAKQLGTVGSGNHYVDLFADEESYLWIGVHFGSRGFGHKTASGFLALAEGKKFEDHATEGEMDSPPIVFSIDSDLGQSYIAAMELAGAYAYAGRDVVVKTVQTILGAFVDFEVTTTITSPGTRNTTARCSGSCGRAAPRPSPANRGLSVPRWQRTASSLRGPRLRQLRSSRRSMVPGG